MGNEMIMRIFVTLLTLALLGCASYVWTKPGATEEDFVADSGSCHIKNFRFVQSETENKPHFKVDQAAYDSCMRERGWVYELQ